MLKYQSYSRVRRFSLEDVVESAAPFRRTDLGKLTGDFMPTWTGLLKRQRLKFVSTYWFDF